MVVVLIRTRGLCCESIDPEACVPVIVLGGAVSELAGWAVFSMDDRFLLGRVVLGKGARPRPRPRL